MIRCIRQTKAKQSQDKSRREFLKATIAMGSGIVVAPNVVWAVDDPIWSAIPDQTWAVGVPVHFDLANYATSQIGAELIFAINKALPNGVSLNGSVISGTPTDVFSETEYVATAEDGNVLDTRPDSPKDLIAE